MTLEEMKTQRERMAELATEARKDLDSITDKTSDTEAKEIEARFDARMVDHDAIDAKLNREDKIATAEKRAVESRRPNPADGSDDGSVEPSRQSIATYSQSYLRNRHTEF